MKTMDENFKKATRSLNSLKTEGEYEEVLIARTLMAQAQATLALAYEQRTANLIEASYILPNNNAQIITEVQERLELI